jgi:hypothetical protein
MYEDKPIGHPIAKRAHAIAVCEFLNSVIIEDYLDPKTLTLKWDIY